MTTETKVEAVAWAIVADGYMVDYSDTTKQRCENVAREYGEGANIAIEPLYPASAITALEGEVADRDAVIECKNIDIRERDRSLHEWAERAKAAERRLAKVKALAGAWRVEARLCDNGCNRQKFDAFASILEHALTKETP